MWFKCTVVCFGPKTVADTGSLSSRAPPPLVGGCQGNGYGFEAGHTPSWIEAWYARQAGIYHHTDAVNGDAGFRNTCGKDDLSLPGAWWH